MTPENGTPYGVITMHTSEFEDDGTVVATLWDTVHPDGIAVLFEFERSDGRTVRGGVLLTEKCLMDRQTLALNLTYNFVRDPADGEGRRDKRANTHDKLC